MLKTELSHDQMLMRQKRKKSNFLVSTALESSKMGLLYYFSYITFH